MYLPTRETLDRIRVEGNNEANRCLRTATAKATDARDALRMVYMAYAKARGKIRYSATRIMGGCQRETYRFPDGSAILVLRSYGGDEFRPSLYGGAIRFIPTLSQLLRTVEEPYEAPTVRSWQPFEYVA